MNITSNALVYSVNENVYKTSDNIEFIGQHGLHIPIVTNTRNKILSVIGHVCDISFQGLVLIDMVLLAW